MGYVWAAMVNPTNSASAHISLPVKIMSYLLISALPHNNQINRTENTSLQNLENAVVIKTVRRCRLSVTVIWLSCTLGRPRFHLVPRLHILGICRTCRAACHLGLDQSACTTQMLWCCRKQKHPSLRSTLGAFRSLLVLHFSLLAQRAICLQSSLPPKFV